MRCEAPCVPWYSITTSNRSGLQGRWCAIGAPLTQRPLGVAARCHFERSCSPPEPDGATLHFRGGCRAGSRRRCPALQKPQPVRRSRGGPGPGESDFLGLPHKGQAQVIFRSSLGSPMACTDSISSGRGSATAKAVAARPNLSSKHPGDQPALPASASASATPVTRSQVAKFNGRWEVCRGVAVASRRLVAGYERALEQGQEPDLVDGLPLALQPPPGGPPALQDQRKR